MSPAGRARLLRWLLIASTLWFSWLAMMLVHESGHCLAALCTGGAVRHVVFHPLALSRTDVEPNPHPAIEVWAGPLFGALGPLLATALFARRKFDHPLWAVVGFCLLANGAYLAVGAFDPVGDAKQLLALSTPRSVLLAVGTAMLAGGFWLWHRVSPAFGFGERPVAIRPSDLCVLAVSAVGLTLLGLLGHRT